MPLRFDTEKEFEDYLMDNGGFMEDELGFQGADIFRQLNLGPYGIADIVAIRSGRDPRGDAYCSIDIVELKNTPLSYEDIAQLARYRRFFKEFDRHFPGENLIVNGHLIGLKTFPSKNDLCFLAQDIEWLTTYEMEIAPREGMILRPVQNWKMSKDCDEALGRVGSMVVPPPYQQPKPAANEG